MKRILILSSLFTVICFALVNLTVEERNASMSLQTENVEALTLTGPITLDRCYMNVSSVSGTGIHYYKCRVGTTVINGEDVIYPCSWGGNMIESSLSSVSDARWCYSIPAPPPMQ
ncbi:MAG: hypothetical protein LBK97_04325 [Prevotellaceae bacterium]|jgi:hypothetical protein|nr:hypothetical protein [Prevotellaceae bacterium]